MYFSYGLLGPSGCGKTTLLRSVLGRLQLDSGHLQVLGDRPGAKGHKVPGNMVGYMPQVLSEKLIRLRDSFSYFSIKQILLVLNFKNMNCGY